MLGVWKGHGVEMGGLQWFLYKVKVSGNVGGERSVRSGTRESIFPAFFFSDASLHRRHPEHVTPT